MKIIIRVLRAALASFLVLAFLPIIVIYLAPDVRGVRGTVLSLLIWLTAGLIGIREYMKREEK